MPARNGKVDWARLFREWLGMLFKGRMTPRSFPTEEELYGRSYAGVHQEYPPLPVTFNGTVRGQTEDPPQTTPLRYWYVPAESRRDARGEESGARSQKLGVGEIAATAALPQSPDPTIRHSPDSGFGNRQLAIGNQDSPPLTPHPQPPLLVVFVHGMFQNRLIWRQVLAEPELAGHADLFAPDLLGMGETPSVPDLVWNQSASATRPGFSLVEVQVNFLYAAINAWLDKYRPGAEPQPVLLVGHSLGGAIVVRMTEDRPEVQSLRRRARIAGVVLVNPYIGTDEIPGCVRELRTLCAGPFDITKPHFGLVAHCYLRGLSVGAYQVSDSDRRPNLPRPFVQSLIAQWLSRDRCEVQNMLGADITDVSQDSPSLPAAYNESFLQVMRHIATRDLPCWFIMGAHDRMMPPPLHLLAIERLNLPARERRDGISYAHIFLCGHHGPVEQPPQTAHVIRQAVNWLTCPPQAVKEGALTPLP